MMSTKNAAARRFPYQPDYAVAPGGTLQEKIEELGMTQYELATRAGLSKKTVNEIIKGKAPITPKDALLFERVTGIPARIWNNLEASYRERLARLREQACLEADENWLKEIPVDELVRRGVIARASSRPELVRVLLNFFRVATVEAWRAYWASPRCSFRKSLAHAGNIGATATWLCLGERDAESIACRPFSKAAFRDALAKIRQLTMEPPDFFLPRIRQLCADAGVAFVVVKEFPGARVSGAAQWLTPDKALIQLSLRFKSDDQFWFSLFHEAGHILYDNKKEGFIDDGESEDEPEARANRFAQDFLIPPGRFKELSGLKSFAQVKAFAASLGIAPGIVVGQLQRHKVIGYNKLNGLKRWFHWDDQGSGSIDGVASGVSP